MTNDSKQRVPRNAFCMPAAAFEFGDNGESAKTVPFRMVARSGEPIDHWYWGRVVHDFDSMSHKDRIAIDYIHDDGEVIGYGNHIEKETGDLTVTGALTPYRENDRASEIIHKQQLGVPYEASINFAGGSPKLEQYGANESVEVNGREFSGPISVIRNWTLRGVAVCPYGYDGNTSTEFSQGPEIEVEIMEAKTAPVEKAETTDPAVELTADETTEAEAVDVDIETDTPAEEPAEKLEQPTEGQRFLDAFGDRGGVWFAQGKSFEEATQLCLTELREQNEKLTQKVKQLRQAAGSGESEPVEFSQEPDKPRRGPIRFADER